MAGGADSPLLAPIEPYIEELATSRELPSFAVSLCTLRYPDSGPLLRAALARGADGTLAGEEDARLFFRALFIVGGRRDSSGFEPLLRFLRRPQEEVEDMLGDAMVNGLPRIAVGMFDGNSDALFDAIVDMRLHEHVRDSLLGAATFLTREGRIERERMVRFLERFEVERLAPAEDFTWVGWVTAVSLLGLRGLVPNVTRAWDSGVIPDFMSRAEFAADLDRTEQTPDDLVRFEENYLGYVEDVLVALEDFHELDDESDDPAELWDETDAPPPPLPRRSFGEPVINPWRHVGRNDPCPCGSGKKAKRCCLAA